MQLAAIDRPASIRSLLRDTAAALAARVQGSRHSLARLAFPLRLITRVGILVCLNASSSGRALRRRQARRVTRLVRRAYLKLPHGMWTEILSFI